MLGYWVAIAPLCPSVAADAPASIVEDRGSPPRSDLFNPIEEQARVVRAPSNRHADATAASHSPFSQAQGDRPASAGVDGLRLPPPRAGGLRPQSTPLEGRSTRWLAERTALVLAAFFALVLAQRRWLPRSQPSTCNGLVKVCGKMALDSKQSLHLLRIGQRLLILLESPQGMQCVAEITDAHEVRQLLDGDPTTHESPSVNVQKVLSTFRQRESSLA
jgi:hypothetical protein